MAVPRHVLSAGPVSPTLNVKAVNGRAGTVLARIG